MNPDTAGGIVAAGPLARLRTNCRPRRSPLGPEPRAKPPPRSASRHISAPNLHHRPLMQPWLRRRKLRRASTTASTNPRPRRCRTRFDTSANSRLARPTTRTATRNATRMPTTMRQTRTRTRTSMAAACRASANGPCLCRVSYASNAR